MTTSLNGNNRTKVNSEEGDDLTRIRGIGLVKQQWLRESLNIYTFQDLACLSVDEIGEQFRVQGHTASQSEIKGWIVHAQELAAAKLPSQSLVEFSDAQAEELSNLQTQEREVSGSVMASVDAKAEGNLLPSTNQASNNQGKWQSFASFRLEFQSRQLEGQVEEQRIRVHYMEADKVEIWSDLESEKLQQWILEQVSERMQPSIEAESPVVTPLVAVEISQMRVFQPPQAERSMMVEKGNRLFPDIINSGEPFALEIAFNLAGVNVTNFTKKQVAYRAQFFARNRLTGVSTHLGDTELTTLIKGQLSYTARLAETTLESGVYRLQAIVTLQGVSATPGSFKVPLLQVV